jgi:hypothetical protein
MESAAQPHTNKRAAVGETAPMVVVVWIVLEFGNVGFGLGNFLWKPKNPSNEFNYSPFCP